MGMAASQARFLGLTARKTNTEYEGQQINQQRTTLSNQSANYYNQLLGMSVPVPPSVSDFTKTTYTFQDGALTNSVTSMIAQKDGTYKISYNSTWQNDFSVVSSPSRLYTRSHGEQIKYNSEGIYIGKEENVQPISQQDLSDLYTNKYTIGATRLRLLGQVNLYTQEDVDNTTVTSDMVGLYKGTTLTNGIVYRDEYLSSLSKEQIKKLVDEEGEYISQLNTKYGTSTRGWLVRYTQNQSNQEWTPIFVNADLLESPNMVYSDETGSSQSTVKNYTVGAALENEEIKGVNARLEQDSSGRIINITLHPGDADEVTYAVTTNTVTDQAKYDDAMNQYEYDKYQYDKSIQEINAKIEIIQAEDKNLELRLKQLDTEQDAIQTEMDAVQKVIEKNTESTFKTFG